MRRARRAVEVLDPDRDDPRLASVGVAAEAWARDDILTIAVRRRGKAPFLVGTVSARMRPAGPGLWALRLRVPALERASIEYALIGDAASLAGPPVWHGPRANPPSRPEWEPVEPLEPHVF